MNMGMRHFHSQDRDTDSLAGDSGFKSDGDLAGKGSQTFIGLLVEIEDIVCLDMPWNYKGMSLGKRTYIEESIEVLVLGNFPRRDFACCYTGKNSSHTN